jgi:hypothetical protein
MSRYLSVLVTVTFVGLAIVYGEVEAMKTGYEIRQLSIQKRDLTHRLKESEFQIATVTSPDKLEERMDSYRVKLASPKTMRIARIGSDPGQSRASSGREGSGLTGFLVPTAQADTAR